MTSTLIVAIVIIAIGGVISLTFNARRRGPGRILMLILGLITAAVVLMVRNS